MRGIVRVCKAALIILLNTAFLLPGLVVAAFPENVRIRAASAGMSIWAKVACSILGIRIKKTAIQKIPPGSLVVANHCSYLDILVLGSLIPGVFVAKQEVASWPLLGWLSRLAGTIFVDRRSRMSAITTLFAIKRRLIADTSVFLFPEGTTNNGTNILTFKSYFFGIPVEKNRPVQPVSIVYSHINGKPVDNHEKDRIAWYGTMSLLPHLWYLLGVKNIDVRVHFSPAIEDITEGLDAAKIRKMVASMAHKNVVAGYEALLTDVTGSL